MESNLIPENLTRKLKSQFSHSLPPGRLHFAAHSHHPWPDVTLDAQVACWKNAARNLDQKWDTIFNDVMPQAQTNVASLMGISHSKQITFGTNTFEFVTRLLSALDFSKEIRIVTTDSEFYSFERFAKRLQEFPQIKLSRVSTQPFSNFEERFDEEIKKQNPHFIFSSLIFFNSGFYASKLLETLQSRMGSAIILIDLYHALGAVPLDLKRYESNFYFVGGGYKYLSAGEGACFLYSPPGSKLRPVLTGWMADFGLLNQKHTSGVGYADDGFRFAGATFDPSGLYRLNAVCQCWKQLGLTPLQIHQHARALQHKALELWNPATALGFRSRDDWGNFFSIAHQDAPRVVDELLKQNVFIDQRGGALRFGFGYYQDFRDLQSLTDILKTKNLLPR